MTVTMVENNDGHPGSHTSSGSGQPKPRPIAHCKNNNNTTTRTDSHDMITDAFRLTGSSPRPQSKGKERAIISCEYPPDTVRSVAHASPANGDRFQAFGESNVSADQTAAGAPAEHELQMGKHAFDDNPGDSFDVSETAAGVATQGETGEDGGNAASGDVTNGIFSVAAPRKEPCQNTNTDVIIPFAGTATIHQTEQSSAPMIVRRFHLG